jgi:hypothetical protein
MPVIWAASRHATPSVCVERDRQEKPFRMPHFVLGDETDCWTKQIDTHEEVPRPTTVAPAVGHFPGIEHFAKQSNYWPELGAVRQLMDGCEGSGDILLGTAPGFPGVYGDSLQSQPQKYR